MFEFDRQALTMDSGIKSELTWANIFVSFLAEQENKYLFLEPSAAMNGGFVALLKRQVNVCEKMTSALSKKAGSVSGDLTNATKDVLKVAC